jgi:hypothetical protein
MVLKRKSQRLHVERHILVDVREDSDLVRKVGHGLLESLAEMPDIVV